MNLLYCLDENYNNQCITSVSSILKNNYVNNLFFIHKNPKRFPIGKITNKTKGKVNNITIFEFDQKLLNNLKAEELNLNNSHVSSATYYRLFIDHYLPNTLQDILYLDSDIICVKSFEKEYINEFKKLTKNNLTISARVIGDGVKNKDLLDRLGMKSNKYFNAGVLFINLDNWRKNKVESSLQKLLFSKKFEYHDQDILNLFFDGRGQELSSKLNYLLKANESPDNQNIVDSFVEKEAILLHYIGASKPWDKKNHYSKNSRYYFENYDEVFQKNFNAYNNFIKFFKVFGQNKKLK